MADTQQLEEETRRLMAEANNLSAKRLVAELKHEHERNWLPPLQLLAAWVVSAVIAVVIAKLIH